MARKGKMNKTDDREAIIHEIMPYIKYTAYRYQWKLPPQMTVDDLISAGTIGLLDAIDKYDAEKNAKLKTYAEFRIRGAMLDEIRANDWAPKTLRKKMNDIRAAYSEVEATEGRHASEDEIAEKLGITLSEMHNTLQQGNNSVMMSIEEMGELRASLGDSDVDAYDFLTDPEETTPLEMIEEKELRNHLASLINSLEEKERLVVTLYYYEELTFKEIGSILGLTESRICQIHSRSLAKMESSGRELVAAA